MPAGPGRCPTACLDGVAPSASAALEQANAARRETSVDSSHGMISPEVCTPPLLVSFALDSAGEKPQPALQLGGGGVRPPVLAAPPPRARRRGSRGGVSAGAWGPAPRPPPRPPWCLLPVRLKPAPCAPRRREPAEPPRAWANRACWLDGGAPGTLELALRVAALRERRQGVLASPRPRGGSTAQPRRANLAAARRLHPTTPALLIGRLTNANPAEWDCGSSPALRVRGESPYG